MHLNAPALILLIPLLTQGQDGSGEIRLNVTDTSGAPAAAEGRFDKAPFKTDPQGSYTFTGVPFGRHRIEVTRTGFAPQSIRVNVESATPIARTVRLAPLAQATSIDVVATTPLPGTDLSIDQIPSPVQTAGSKEIAESNALDLPAVMNRRLNGVYVNDNSENPFEPDVNYRGYTASSLLGTPEGLSVYMDGVRQNQPFGDIVSWDLIPKIAIDEMTLMPGSDPLYGLNTLGGALSIQTKGGITHPGTTIQATGGMFGRRAVEAEYGGSSRNGFNWYLAGNLYREDGWRQFSPSEVRQSFAKLGWSHHSITLSLSIGYADNWLTGNGLQDFRFLQQSYSSVYTIPDITWNHSPSFNFTARHDLTNNLMISGNAYFRYIRSDTTNGDVNTNSFDQSLYNLNAADVAALTQAGYTNFPVTGNATTEPFPYWRCIAQALEKADPSDRCDGVIAYTYTKQNNYGLAAQVTRLSARNHFTAGAAWDRSGMSFQQYSQFGYLNSDRLTITPVPAFADGSTSSGGVPVDTRVYLHGMIDTFSLFATDTLTAGKWNFTFSGRFNRTGIDNIDRLAPAPDGVRGSLNGSYVFGRFNPSAGLTYAAMHFFSVYFSYSESSRAPTAIELGCADPNQPCNLPNALVGDPPLRQVVTRTLEAGIRGANEKNLRWSAGWFRGSNDNDLLFIASPQSGFGYFSNFGQTLREGAEANLSGRFRRIVTGGGYTFLNATYQSSQTLPGSSNSSSDVNSNIEIVPGDRIPQTPRHTLKAYADYDATRKLSIDLDFLAVSRSFARGNENNLDRPDGFLFLGPGSSPGYGVVNLGAHYQAWKNVQLFAEINNFLDHRYYTAAQLGPSPFDNNGNFAARPFPPVDGNYPIRTTTFLAPGAPFTVFGGMRFTF